MDNKKPRSFASRLRNIIKPAGKTSSSPHHDKFHCLALSVSPSLVMFAAVAEEKLLNWEPLSVSHRGIPIAELYFYIPLSRRLNYFWVLSTYKNREKNSLFWVFSITDGVIFLTDLSDYLVALFAFSTQRKGGYGNWTHLIPCCCLNCVAQFMK